MSLKEAGRLAVVRQIKRLCRSVRSEGEMGLISKCRGRPSNRLISDAVRQQALALALALVRERYNDFDPQLACEHLAREHGFVHNTETLRGWMIGDSLRTPKRRRTERHPQPASAARLPGRAGAIDGSHHHWFEGRAGKCCLIAFIDDATSGVLGARFGATETTNGYLDMLQRSVAEHGAPLALYSDRHSIFTKHDRQDPSVSRSFQFCTLNC